MIERVLLAQVAPVIGDVAGNLALCRQALAEGKARNVDLVLLSELVLSGYPPRDLLERDELVASCLVAAEALTRETLDGPTLMFGLPVAEAGRLYNAAWIAHRGERVAVARKCLLPVYDVFDEGRYFTPAEAPTIVEIDGTRIGVTICEDIWNDREVFPDTPYERDPVEALVGVDLIVNLSASPFHAGKNATRLQLCRAKARLANAPILYCNMVGGNDELLFDGASIAVRADGTLFAQGPPFRSAWIEADVSAPAVPFASVPFEEEVVEALVMGVRDYAMRCGFRTAVVGLSGGIDSAVVAAIAAQALGPESVFGVGMPGPFSSPGSLTDAEALARNLGIGFTVVPIREIHDAFLRTLAPVFEGRKPDVTEENLQARARGSVLMALSNKFGHLLLTTGNKSEMAVGYCTLYGDMNGGLAVISDVFKTDVYRIARWLNRGGRGDPRRDDRQAAVGGARAEPDRPGLAPAVRGARCHPAAVRRGDRRSGTHRRARPRSRDGRAGGPDGGAERVQALAGGARSQGEPEGVRDRAAHPAGEGLEPGALSLRRFGASE